jgi:hypothetical protein
MSKAIEDQLKELVKAINGTNCTNEPVINKQLTYDIFDCIESVCGDTKEPINVLVGYVFAILETEKLLEKCGCGGRNPCIGNDHMKFHLIQNLIELSVPLKDVRDLSNKAYDTAMDFVIERNFGDINIDLTYVKEKILEI